MDDAGWETGAQKINAGSSPVGSTRRSALARLAEDTRFELVRVLSQHAFQACALGH